MGTVTYVPGSKTSVTGFSTTLANGTFDDASVIDLGASPPYDVSFEFTPTPGTVSGNKRVMLYAQESHDNTTFTSGPVSGTSTTDEPNLKLVGECKVLTNSAARTQIVTWREAFNRPPSRYIKPVLFNDSGAALTGLTLHYVPITQTY